MGGSWQADIYIEVYLEVDVGVDIPSRIYTGCTVLLCAVPYIE